MPQSPLNNYCIYFTILKCILFLPCSRVIYVPGSSLCTSFSEVALYYFAIIKDFFVDKIVKYVSEIWGFHLEDQILL